MRVPQVSERIKEAPAQALRGVFAGIGQLLLITDKIRHKTPSYHSAPPTRRPQPSQTATETTTTESAAPREDAAPTLTKPTAAETAPAQPVPAGTAPVQGVRPTARKSPTPPPPRDFDKTGNVRVLDDEPGERDDPGEPGAPLANYDELSIASLRARLRNLDVAQLRQLAGYERAHQARAEVIAMFERRIVKLEAEGSVARDVR